VFVKTYIFVSHGKYLSLFNVLKQKWLDHIEFDSEIVQVFRSEDGNGGFDICVLQKSNMITIITRTNEAYEDGTVGKYKITSDLKVEGEFLQHDQDRDDNRFTFIMSQLDNEQILLNCFYQRKFYNISKHFNGLNRNTNFVFIFAEAEETRFAIQEEGSIYMYEIRMKEKEIEKNDDDSDEEKEV
jgi:hypothetical protein